MSSKYVTNEIYDKNEKEKLLNFETIFVVGLILYYLSRHGWFSHAIKWTGYVGNVKCQVETIGLKLKVC